jgi:lysozyme
VWTIGYGHTGNVHEGDTITQAEADALLQKDVQSASLEVAAVAEVVLTPNQFSALVSFQYNTGALPGSQVLAAINADSFTEAMDHLALYVRDATGAVLEGLVRRRAAERALFLTP